MQDGTTLSLHRDKEQLLLEDFKERLGKSEFTSFGFDPSTFLERRDDLGSLEEPFSSVEIDSIIKHLPNDRSPVQMASAMSSLNQLGQLSRVISTTFVNHSIAIMCVSEVSTHHTLLLFPKIRLLEQLMISGQYLCSTPQSSS